MHPPCEPVRGLALGCGRSARAGVRFFQSYWMRGRYGLDTGKREAQTANDGEHHSLGVKISCSGTTIGNVATVNLAELALGAVTPTYFAAEDYRYYH